MVIENKNKFSHSKEFITEHKEAGINKISDFFTKKKDTRLGIEKDYDILISEHIESLLEKDKHSRELERIRKKKEHLSEEKEHA